jgi:chromosome segregation ATPase
MQISSSGLGLNNSSVGVKQNVTQGFDSSASVGNAAGLRASRKLKRFIIHLSKAATKLNEVNNARAGLRSKLNEMKSLKSRPLKEIKSEFDDHINELNEKINFLVESERKILSRSPGTVISDQTELIEKINSLQEEIRKLREENKKIGVLTTTVESLKSQIDLQEKSKLERYKRIEELENKISSRVDSTGVEVLEIEKKLSYLSSKYDELFSSGSHSESDLLAIKNKIDDLKSVLLIKKGI